MINKKQLCKFLVKAKKAGYASGDKTNKIKEENKSKTITFKSESYKYYDNYFGGDPFKGKKVYETRYAGGLVDQRKEKNM